MMSVWWHYLCWCQGSLGEHKGIRLDPPPPCSISLSISLSFFLSLSLSVTYSLPISPVLHVVVVTNSHNKGCYVHPFRIHHHPFHSLFRSPFPSFPIFLSLSLSLSLSLFLFLFPLSCMWWLSQIHPIKAVMLRLSAFVLAVYLFPLSLGGKSAVKWSIFQSWKWIREEDRWRSSEALILISPTLWYQMCISEERLSWHKQTTPALFVQIERFTSGCLLVEERGEILGFSIILIYEEKSSGPKWAPA